MASNTTKVGVIGASGYTGGELLRLLSQHPQVTISKIISSEKSAGRKITDLFPHLSSLLSLTLEPLKPEAIAKQTDLVFLALPHTESLQAAATLLELGIPVIDLSADFRIKDASVYEQWYGVSHPSPHLLQEAVYGLPELHRAEIPQSRLIAVPGCYPTAAILQLAPLVSQQLVEPNSVLIDAKSGVSGAGRGLGLSFHFPEAHDGIHAYKIGKHRHLPEIQQELDLLFQAKSTSDSSSPSLGSISFTPHLVPMNRGILSTAYVKLPSGLPPTDWHSLYETFYKNEPFIRFFPNPDMVNPNHVKGSNFCDLGVTYDPRSGWLISVAALDNLVKGAAGQAIQAMNLMLGFPEQQGLMAPGVFP